ncbi:hypothetical protein TRFO_32039 [Tritrichomonas foetus]|uniref:HYDIN/VesB/CFA65-like Ig-like domain-containing protein n=1 Tax=Tritrichomonas foetus TaxID=1144522 RepID=A0A1J4JQ20_9EUKA|nr:hypothetical protein TRFO_32039 [Tritrichomonas foetus]|eukprot:OHT01209.1 hypothetical protein TRFO_32039 [Tritrichomonas foetus]
MFEEEEEEESPIIEKEVFSISAFPEIATFPPTYRGVFSHFTLFILNPFSTMQTVNLSLDSNSCFSVASNEINISPGIVYSLIITFISDEVGQFETELIVTSESSTITVPLKAKCIPSPLVFDDEEITSCQFSMAKTSLVFNIANRSLVKSLHVLFDFDSASFSITPPSIDLPPFSICPIEIKYDINMNFDFSSAPNFHIQCSESGDSISIPLTIIRPNTSGMIEFGCVPICTRQFKQINYSENKIYLDYNEAPELALPFSYQLLNDVDKNEEEEEEFDNLISGNSLNNDETGENTKEQLRRNSLSKRNNKYDHENDNIMFSFYSEVPGDFNDTVQFGPLKFTLHAIAVVPPFRIKAVDDVSSQVILENTSNEKRSYYISFTNIFDRKHATKISLLSGASEKIDTLKSNGFLYVRWRENDQKVTQQIELPRNDIEVNEDTVSFELNYGYKKKKSLILTNKSEKKMKVKLATDNPEFSLLHDKAIILKPHSIHNVDIEFNPKSPQSVRGHLKVQTDESIKKVPLKSLSAILTSSNLINFFRIDENISDFVLSFCGPKTVKIDKPNWIECDEIGNSNLPIKLSCQRIPNSVSSGYLKLDGKNCQPLSIPILAYRSSSDISVRVVRPHVLRVENHGLRTAFITFTTNDDRLRLIDASPQCGFIPFNGSMTFTFPEDVDEILVHSGDEIVRQILSFIDPDNFFSTTFESIDLLRDEISSISTELLEDLDVKEFLEIFNQQLSTQLIDVSEVNHDLFTISSQKIDFGEVGIFQTKEMKIWIENQKLRPLELLLTSKNNLLTFPAKIFLKSEQRFLLKISLICSKEQEINDSLIIQSSNKSDNFYKKVDIKGFIVDTAIKFEADVLNFGICEVGRIMRGQLRLVNKKKESTNIVVSASPPFSCPKNSFSIEPGCFVLLPVHFTPLRESSFQGRILFEPEHSHRFYIPVLGSALFDPPEI